jgi:D-3-phosphoglycerate dehydrogenase / 2-oxoglutarate reductase
VISLHCALTSDTRGMINADLLARAKPGAALVNAARGPIVASEDDLLVALRSGRLSAVAMDVFPTEPPNLSHALYSDPRVICTPHSIGLTESWNRAVFGLLARSVGELLGGGVPSNVLNPEALVHARA